MSFRNQLAAGVRLIREALQSPNFVTGTSGWSIDRDGSAEFSDVAVNGGSLTTSPSGDGSTVVIEDGSVIFYDSSNVEVGRIRVQDVFSTWPMFLTFSDELFIGSDGDVVTIGGFQLSPFELLRETLVVTGASPIAAGTATMAATTTVSFPDVGHWVPHLYAYPILDIDAAGRAGFVIWERQNSPGGAWTTVASRRWHDSTEGENADLSLICTDHTNPTDDVQIRYRVRVTVDGSLNSVNLRSDSTAYVEWWYRAL